MLRISFKKLKGAEQPLKRRKTEDQVGGFESFPPPDVGTCGAEVQSVGSSRNTVTSIFGIYCHAAAAEGGAANTGSVLLSPSFLFNWNLQR